MHRYIPMQTVVFRKQSLTGITNLVSMNENQFNSYAFIEPKKNSPYKIKKDYLNACDNSKFLNETGNISRITNVINSIMESGTNSQKEETLRYINNNLLPKLNRTTTSIFTNQINKNLLNENYTNSINDTISIYKECDRVLNNDNKLSKRFNFNKYIQENYNKKSPRELVFSLCEMVDTYNIKPKAKFYIALESVQYALYNSPVKMDNVVKDITDYFLLRESIIPDNICVDYKNSIKDNQFIEPSELSKLRIVKSDSRDTYLSKIDYIKNHSIDNENVKEMLDRIRSISTEEHASQYIKGVYNAIMNDATLSENDKIILKRSINMIPLVTSIDQPFIDYEVKKIDGILLGNRDLLETVSFINEYFSEDTESISAPNMCSSIEDFKINQDKSPSRFIRLLSNFNISSEYAVKTLIKALPELFLIMRYTYVSFYPAIKDDNSLESILQEYLYLFDRIEDYADQKDLADIRKSISDEIRKVEDTLSNILSDEMMCNRFLDYKLMLNKSLKKIDYYMDNDNYTPYNESCVDTEGMELEDYAALIETMMVGADNINKLNKEELLSSISDNIRLFTTDTDNLRNLSNILMISKCVDKSAYESILIKRAGNDDCAKSESLIIANELSYMRTYTDLDTDVITESLLAIEATNILEKAFLEETIDEGLNVKKPDMKNIKKKAKININDIKIAFRAFQAKIQKLDTKVKSMWQTIDARGNTIMNGIQQSMKSDRREQIIKGSIVPSMSQCLKQLIAIAGTSTVGAFFGAPYIGVLTAVGIFATNKVLNDREKQIIYDEIDTELKVVDKEIELALQDGDTKKYRFLLTYQKKLKRERTRIKYGTMARSKSIPV